MKKLIAFGLAATLAISTATVAFAGPLPAAADSEAGIDFEWGDEFDNPGVYDPRPGPDPTDPTNPVNPELPPIPGGPNFWDQFGPMGLYFGMHDIAMVDATYHSWDDGNTRAGMAVVAREDWHVNVSINGFFIGPRTVVANQTIQGFELDLLAENSAAFGASTITTVAVNNLAAHNDGGVGATARIAEGGRGFSGANFNGLLEVLGDTADPGFAQADLFWTFVVGP